MSLKNPNNERKVVENSETAKPPAIHVLFESAESVEMAINVEGRVNAGQLSLAAAELNFIADQLRIKAAMIEAERRKQSGILVPEGAGVPKDIAKGILQ